MADLASVAYWYPEPYWAGSEADGVKSLLPFFDGVAILLPPYMHGRHRSTSPWLVEPLEDRGLLHVLQPETFVDQAMTSQLCEIVAGLLGSGVFADLEVPEHRYGYHELSWSRLGWNADVELSSELVDSLLQRQLALPSENGVSVPLHPAVRTTVLVLLSQLAPRAGRERGLDLHPLTSSRERIHDLLGFLRRPGMPSAGDVVGMDTESVGVDLAPVPLDDVLAFRDEHGSGYRAYARNVRQFVRQLSLMDSDDRESAMADRREELADMAAALRQLSREHWRLPLARVAVGGAGAMLSLATGTPIPAGISALAAAVLEWDPATDQGGAFSYLFEVQRSIGA